MSTKELSQLIVGINYDASPNRIARMAQVIDANLNEYDPDEDAFDTYSDDENENMLSLLAQYGI